MSSERERPCGAGEERRAIPPDTQQRLRMRHAELLVRGGTVLTPSGAQMIDIACVDGRIAALDTTGWSADETLDAQGLHVLPGVIDSQVHVREPGLTHKETFEAGPRGAVLGGVTAVFEMPNTHPLTLHEADLNAKLAIAQMQAWCDHAFYIGGSAVNAEQLASLEMLPGCAGVKVFMGSSFGDLLADEDAVLRRILRHGHRRMAVHAEDEARLRERRIIAEGQGGRSRSPTQIRWRRIRRESGHWGSRATSLGRRWWWTAPSHIGLL